VEKKVLVVDDEMHVVKILKFKLKNEGYNVLTALNGNDAIELAKHEVPDIILLDIMMPGMDGYKVFEILKDDEATSSIPVIMVTARTQEVDKSRAEKLGVAEYIFKPFSLQNVIDAISRVLV